VSSLLLKFLSLFVGVFRVEHGATQQSNSATGDKQSMIKKRQCNRHKNIQERERGSLKRKRKQHT